MSILAELLGCAVDGRDACSPRGDITLRACCLQRLWHTEQTLALTSIRPLSAESGHSDIRRELPNKINAPQRDTSRIYVAGQTDLWGMRHGGAMEAGWIFQFLWAPVVATAVSVIYFGKARAMPMLDRLLVSGHGVALALIFVSAFTIAALGMAHERFETPFMASFIAPIACAGLAFWRYEGSHSLHLLQFVNLAAGLWIAFLGVMAITGNWL